MQHQNGSSTPTDYDLHGIVGIRLVDAGAGDADAVDRQLGLRRTSLTGAPDLSIRFVDRLTLASPLHLIGVDDAGFTEDAFLVLRSKHKSGARVQIPMVQIGDGPCEIVCERGLPAVPLLIPILNLVALSKGALPIHAAAFRFRGKGILATGWSKGGKTETLLAFAAHGARYIGDEWVYIGRDGQTMYGLPEPIRVWDWHFDSMPQWKSQIGRVERTRLWTLQRTVQGMSLVSGNGTSLNRSGRLAQRMMPLIKQQLCTDLPPEQLFGESTGPLSSSLDQVLFVVSHDRDEIVVDPMQGEEIAQRIVFSLQAERLPFLEYYLKFRFAFPRSPNRFLEEVEEHQRALLLQMLSTKPACSVRHPYPVSLPALFAAVEPYIKEGMQS